MDPSEAKPEPKEIADKSDPNGKADPNGAARSEEEELEDKRMSLLEHLQELRVRLRNAAVAFVLAMVAAFIFVERFFQVLVRPLCLGIEDAGYTCNLQATGPTEGFWVMLKLAIVGGLIVAAPLVFWELWKFVAPGLYKKEKRLALAITGSTAICFVGGALFGYYVLTRPAGYFLTKMLTSFGVPTQAEVQPKPATDKPATDKPATDKPATDKPATDKPAPPAPTGQAAPAPAEKHGAVHIKPEYRIEEVANFLMLTLAGCGVSFELPILLVILGGLGMISARGLWKFNKYALILCAVAGALLTPSTDPFTQLLLAGPLFALYNISILAVWLIERARKKKDAALEGTGAA